MNADSGHLVNTEALNQFKGDPRYTELPEELNRAAKLKLRGRSEAMVSLTSGGKLSRWAARQRKVKRKIQKESRRRNRV